MKLLQKPNYRKKRSRQRKVPPTVEEHLPRHKELGFSSNICTIERGAKAPLSSYPPQLQRTGEEPDGGAHGGALLPGAGAYDQAGNTIKRQRHPLQGSNC